MARVPVEDPVPYDQSRVWQLQDVYFDARGLQAWEAGDIPFGATSNPLIARQHAAFLAEMFPTGEVTVVELGGGNGAFAAAYLNALATSRKPAVRSLAKRTRYVLTDVWAKNLQALATAPRFARWIAAGTLTLATFDIREPSKWLGLDGRPVDVRPTVVIANYLACVTPTKILHKSPLGWLERWARLTFESDEDVQIDAAWERLRSGAAGADAIAGSLLETMWVPHTPEQTLPEHQAGAVHDVLANLFEGTVAVPYLFLGVVERFAREYGSWTLITDFGRPTIEELRGPQKHDPVMYGQCLSHPVDFPVLDSWGARAEIDVLRTEDPLRSVHIAAARPMSDVQEPFVRAFWRAYGNRDAEEYFDLQVALREAYGQKDWARAARFARVALRTDPDNVDLLHRFGTAMVSAGYPHHAVHALRRGRRLAPNGVLDFDFALGRAFLDARDYRRAVRAFKRALAHGETAVALVDLGRAYLAQGHRTRAIGCIDRAVAIAPDDAYAKHWSEVARR